MHQDDLFYQAMLSRDFRFDGKFFAAVKTTGIYCRPICPARPKRENIEFFLDRFAAERAGYRPCLRCHPEFAPSSVVWTGKSILVQRALTQISKNALSEKDLEELSRELHVSSRHLRRLFEEEIGLSPKQISNLHRLNFAHKLITETDLEMTEIAFASGFRSLRRFNDAFKKRYHQPPSRVRKKEDPCVSDHYTLKLSYRPPFDFQTSLHYFKRHHIPYLEQVDKSSYTRLFKEKKHLGILQVTDHPDTAELKLKVFYPDPKGLFSIVNRVRKMFDLDSDPLLIANAFRANPFLNQLWEQNPGLRITRGWDSFEVSIGTILGQLVSVEQASRLMGDLVKQYGEKVIHPLTQEEAFLFPSPQVLAESTLSKIKTTGRRKEAIKAFAQAMVDKKISLSEVQDMSSFKQALQTIKGIGSWTSEYIALRALGETNAFPKEDLIIKKALLEQGHLFDLSSLQPWLGYLAIYLWKTYPKEKVSL